MRIPASVKCAQAVNQMGRPDAYFLHDPCSYTRAGYLALLASLPPAPEERGSKKIQDRLPP